MRVTSHKSLILVAAFSFLLGCTVTKAPAGAGRNENQQAQTKETPMVKKVIKSDREWKDALTPEEYRVLRQSGTERPFTGKYNGFFERGTYVCAACGAPLFSSETKYEHGTGWPSFKAPLDESRIERRSDYSLLMKRIEVRCAACGSHLGHVFDDGPAPTRKHYCINSSALDFKPALSPAATDSPAEEPQSASASGPASRDESAKTLKTETATFAAGCFWGVEDKFRQVKGVISTRVGYTGGNVENPTYSLVCSDTTGHAESVEIVFDPSVVSYDELLQDFFRFHNPTQVDRQGPDVGEQYRSAIFYHNDRQKEAALKMIERLEKSGKYRKKIATQVVPAPKFYQAEEYHQQYYKKLRGKR
jgi:peptide methionine sulfoxide reductase msrA/msrB